MTIYTAVDTWQGGGLDYGRSDCCQFANHVVKTITGRDCIPWTYSTLREALAIQKEHGGLEGAVTHCLGDPVPYVDAAQGDPVLWKDPDQHLEGLGVKFSPITLLTITQDGKGPVPVHARYAVKAWRVV